MNLENTVKYHFAKSTMISDSPRATASDSLTGTDIMAAMGMTQERAAMGYSAFLGKMGISNNDREKAIMLLAEYALTKCDKVAALRKLGSGVKPLVMRQLAIFAFEDYSRSAGSVKQCDCCAGAGFIQADVFTNKFRKPEGKMTVSGMVNVKETVHVLCKKCNGTGTLSAACSDCHGRGKAMSKELTDKQGVPVMADCKRCGGRGYERIPSTEAYAALSQITDAVSLDTWKKSVKPFYVQLISKLEIEESRANAALNKVTV
ncbi:antitermination protein [Siccibacter turicensis]|uniref:antitermination protein n=1 Tax=Siccibacter turicensis TaxID=357233 RepID=UPI002A6A57FB|nr:antitermination protein [Siccibacter turicensis]MDY0972591.1 antitermination protein [Siccibacter turicensis]